MCGKILTEEKIVVCHCGSRRFEISITGGVNGKTHAFWFKCVQCGASRGMRKIMKEFGT